MRQIARNNRNKCSCVNFATINNRFSGLLFLNSKRIGGGAFISVHLYEWSFCTSESERKENYSQIYAVSAPLVGLKNDGPGRTIRVNRSII